MTIISRVVNALRAHGNNAEADELQQMLKGLTDNIEQLLANVKAQQRTMRTFISVVQSRCKHANWYLVCTNIESNPATWGPEDTIACFDCGLTVCDERAYAHGKRVLQGHSFMYSRSNPRMFGLDPSIRKHLGDKLIVKEIDIDAHQEALRVACNSAGKGPPPGVIAPVGGGDGGDGRSVGA
jgi:hypothetical protein